jgi:hypothetical protein
MAVCRFERSRTERWDSAKADEDAKGRLQRSVCDTSEVRRFVVLLLALTVARSADKSPPKPFSRARAAAIIANARKIVSANGIERLEKVRIGGIEQWVSIRGYDNRTPCCSSSTVGRDMSRCQ